MEIKKGKKQAGKKAPKARAPIKPKRLYQVTHKIAKPAAEDISMVSLNKEFSEYLKEYDLALRSSTSKAKFTDLLMDDFLIVQIIKKGIPYSVFEEIQKISPFTTEDWAEILSLSTKSLSRYKTNDQLFKSIHSEKIIELAEIFILGSQVFGENEKFRLWLQIPNYALGNLRPFELLSDSYGKDLIIDELNRIEHGIFS